MKLETNINEQLSVFSSKPQKTKNNDILNEAGLNLALKNHLKKAKLNLTKVLIKKENGKFNLEWKFADRLYNESFIEDNYNTALEKAVSIIDKTLNSIYETVPSISNRKQRRQFLKDSKYFSNKKRLSYKERGSLVTHNIKKGKEAADNFLTDCIKTNVAYIIYRETKYRELLSNKPKDEVNKLIEKWYNTVIKDKSFLTDK